MAPKNSTSFPSPKSSSPRTTNAAPFSLDSSKSLGHMASKSTNLPEKLVDSKNQFAQLQEELRKAKEDRSKALRELEEVKKNLSSQDGNKIKSLEGEVEKAKVSERRMLESLISQTKQLEQTKILLEEAKLEMHSLQASTEGKNLDKSLEKNGFHDVAVLRNELRSALEAEEKAKKAMDDLAIALKEVATESNQVKSKLSETQSEMEKVKTEADQSKALLKTTEEKLRLAVNESERLRSELDESAAACTVKENGFKDMISKTLEENDRLIDSQRTAREENLKLRDILKQAVNEATVVKEALEIARSENSDLQNRLHEKEQALQKFQQEFDSLKVSEAAATDSLNQLNGMVYNTSDNIGLSEQSKEIASDDNDGKNLSKVASERVKGDNPHVRNTRRHSMFDNSQELEREHRMFASVSNISDWRVPSSLVAEDVDVLNSDDFHRIEGSQLESLYNDAKQKKKRTMLKRFSDMLRRRNSQK